MYTVNSRNSNLQGTMESNLTQRMFELNESLFKSTWDKNVILLFSPNIINKHLFEGPQNVWDSNSSTNPVFGKPWVHCIKKNLSNIKPRKYNRIFFKDSIGLSKFWDSHYTIFYGYKIFEKLRFKLFYWKSAPSLYEV